MPKTRSEKQFTEKSNTQARQRNRVKWAILLLALLILFVVIGCNSHPTCTQNCQNQPAYFYGLPLPHSSYSQFYDTDNDGNPTHSSAGDDDNSGHNSAGDDNSGHSNSGDDDDDSHGGGFDGGDEP